MQMKTSGISMKALRFLAVLSHLSAMRLKRLSFPMVCSMRALALVSSLGKKIGRALTRFLKERAGGGARPHENGIMIKTGT